MKALIVVNDGPYGTERAYNGLRLAVSLAKREGDEIKVFLIGDGVSCAKKGQKVPQGYYNIAVALQGFARHRGEIGVCGSCMDARGLAEGDLVEGARRSTLDELTNWMAWADKAMAF